MGAFYPISALGFFVILPLYLPINPLVIDYAVKKNQIARWQFKKTAIQIECTEAGTFFNAEVLVLACKVKVYEGTFTLQYKQLGDGFFCGLNYFSFDTFSIY